MKETTRTCVHTPIPENGNRKLKRNGNTYVQNGPFRSSPVQLLFNTCLPPGFFLTGARCTDRMGELFFDAYRILVHLYVISPHLDNNWFMLFFTFSSCVVYYILLLFMLCSICLHLQRTLFRVSRSRSRMTMSSSHPSPSPSPPLHQVTPHTSHPTSTCPPPRKWKFKFCKLVHPVLPPLLRLLYQRRNEGGGKGRDGRR